jgi:cytochrome P450
MDPPEHDVHRGTLAGVFTPRRVAELEPRMGELCGQLLDRYVGSDGFEFIHAFAAPFPMAVIGAMLSIRSSDFAELSESFMHHGAAGPAFVKLQDYFREVVDEQRASPTDSLVGDLVQARIPDGETDRLLTDDEILVQLGVLAFGGAETTNRLLGWSMVVLADHPDQRQELQSFDDDLLKGAFEELLRFQPPNIYAGRFTTRDVEKYGEVVPEGSPVVFLLPAAGRDERVFDDPHRFDIHRPTAANQVGFGAGPHYCLGAALARLEGRVALREIVRRWPEWHVDLDRSERVASPQVRGFNALWVVPGA